MNPLSFFKNLSKKSYSVIFPTWDSLDIAEGRSSGRSATDLLRYNEISLYVNRAIDKRAEKVSEVEFILRKRDTEIEEHPLLNLLNRPNEFHTGRQFWKLYQKYLDITGASFIYIGQERELFAKAAVPKELHLLRPDLVNIVFKDGKIAGYEYTPKNGTPRTFKPEEIIYSFNPDPQKPLEGESILRAGIRAIDTELQLADYHSRVLKNGGRVDGVFKFKAALNKAQMTELKESYDSQYGEAKKSGKPLFLGGDSDYTRVSLSPDELSYLESKNVTLDEICLMTGVPRAILARTSEETFANADASIAIFLRETIKPLLVNLSSLLDWRLVPEDMELDFRDPTPEDIDRKVKIVTAAHTVGAATTNEKRELLGLDALKDKAADEVLIPFNLTPLGQKPEPKEPVKEPKEEKKSINHPLRDEYVRKRYGEVMVKRMDRREAEFKQAMNNYFDGQRERVISHISQTRVFRRKDLFDETLDRDAEIRLAKGTALPLLKAFLEEAGADALDLMGSSYDFNLSSEIASWLDGRAEKFADQITDTTFEKLKRQFAESLEAGESRQDLVKRIEATYDGWDEARANLIARTEVHAATQKGTFEGYRQTGAPIKIWATVGDLDVRHTHQIDGEERPIDTPFSNGLMYPGDERGDAEDVINCRCSI